MRVRTYHLLQAGLFVEPCLARDAHMRVKFVSERRSLALKEMEMLGGEAAGSARTNYGRSPPAFDT